MWPDRVSNPGFYNVYWERRPQCRSKIHSAVMYMETRGFVLKNLSVIIHLLIILALKEITGQTDYYLVILSSKT